MAQEVEEQFRQLVAQICRHPLGSLQRQQGLTKLIRLISHSKKLWQENTLYYQDALQQTWMYLCQNLCESGTGQKYNPDRSSVTTWLNRYLKWRLLDFRLAEQANQKRKSIIKSGEKSDRATDPIENLAASPDIPPILESTRNWCLSDPEGELQSLSIRGHPTVTCQVLILKRLPPETSWEDLSREFGISVSTLSSFYQRQCLPQLRKFGETEGYL